MKDRRSGKHRDWYGRLLRITSVAAVLLAGRFAHADDWLAVWPTCSIGDGSRPTLSLLYPAPGLPAIVHAGEPLIARLRTPSALTPPPGVQQERVLERWAVELVGSAVRVGVQANERHRHVLPVTSLRPDDADSLVYRIRIEIPAYLAPGTYALALRTPFGTRSVQQALRVLAKGAAPRFARLPADLLRPPAAAGTWPVDVWLAGAGAAAEEAARERELSAGTTPVAALTSDAAPTLLREGSAVALRVGSELWVRNGCDDPSAFERDVRSVLASESRTRARFGEPRAGPQPSAAELATAALVSARAGAAEVDNRTGRTARELSLLLPFASRASVDAGELSLYPASEPGARTPLAKLARWSVPPGVRATLRLGAARDPANALALRPSVVRSGQPVRVRVVGADSRAKVAFSLGFARSAYASPDLQTTFAGPLAHPVRAQVFETDGAGQVVHGHLWVEPHRPPNCAIPQFARPAAPTSPLAGSALTFACALLVCQRRFAKKARLGRSVE